MCVSYSAGKLTYDDVNAVLGSADFYKIAQTVNMLLTDNSGGALSCAEEIFAGGKSAGVFVKDVLSFLNSVSVAKMCRNAKEILNLPEEMFAEVCKIAQADGHKILRATEIFVKAEGDMRYASDARVVLETAILRCTLPEADYNIDSLIARVAALEKKVAEGVPAQIVMPAQAPSVQESAPNKGGFYRAEEGKSFADRAANAPSKQAGTAEERPSADAGGRQYGDVQTDFLRTGGKATPFYAAEPAAKKPSLTQTEEGDVFAGQKKPAAASGAPSGKSVLATLLRALRTTHKNAVLFTLCSDLGCIAEGGKTVFTTDNETVYRAITRQDNAKILSEVLAEAGAGEYEVRLVKKDDAFKNALDILKSNFGGTDINIK